MNVSKLDIGHHYAIKGGEVRNHRGALRAQLLEKQVPQAPDTKTGRYKFPGAKVLFEGETGAVTISTHAILMRWDTWLQLTEEEQFALVPSVRVRLHGVGRGKYVRQPKEIEKRPAQKQITAISTYCDIEGNKHGIVVALADGRVFDFRDGSGWNALPPIPV